VASNAAPSRMTTTRARAKLFAIAAITLSVLIGVAVGISVRVRSAAPSEASPKDALAACAVGPNVLLQASAINNFYRWQLSPHVAPPLSALADPVTSGPSPAAGNVSAQWEDGIAEGLLTSLTLTPTYLTWQSERAKELHYSWINAKTPLLPLSGPIVTDHPDSALEFWEQIYVFRTAAAASTWVGIANDGTVATLQAWPEVFIPALGRTVSLHQQTDPTDNGRFDQLNVTIASRVAVDLEVHGGQALSVQTAAAVFNQALTKLTSACGAA
jgi:hypothetical protein